METLNTITLKDNVYYIKFNNYVLEEVQERFGSIYEFELKLLGKKKIVNEDKTITIEDVEPSVKVINFTITRMIREGERIHSKETGEKRKLLFEEDIIDAINLTPKEMAIVIHAEFVRCFETKK